MAPPVPGGASPFHPALERGFVVKERPMSAAPIQSKLIVANAVTTEMLAGARIIADEILPLKVGKATLRFNAISVSKLEAEGRVA